MRDIFSDYYQNNFWGDDESVSGAGSNLKATAMVRKQLPTLFAQLGITSLLDIPCGDFYWMSHVEGLANIRYVGGDIVPELIYENRERYVHPKLEFQVFDITRDRLPETDLILCRDLLGHFSNHDVQRALKNLRTSGSTYLLSTTFPDHETVGDIRTGEWRPINLASLFGLPAPLLLINEGLKGEFSDKSLGLWKL